MWRLLCDEWIGSGSETTKGAKNCQEEGRDSREGQEQPIGALAPDHPLLVQKVVDHFDAVAHLRLRPPGHGNHRPADLAGLDVIKRGDAFRPAFFQLLFVACHARPSYDHPAILNLRAILTPGN